MKDLGELKWFLGFEFNISDNFVEMNQTKYVNKVLIKFDMDQCKPKSLPCEMMIDDLISQESDVLEDPKLYREIIGSLIYLMTGTRPDLSFVVTKLSQCMNNPTKTHLSLAKHVLRYIKYTSEYSLKFSQMESCKLTGFCDSDWGSSSDRHSISGYCFFLNDNGPLISWKSKRQSVISLSSCEAEYVSLALATQEAVFLRQLFADMLNINQDVVLLCMDNQGAISLAKNPVNHQRTKHIDIKFHYIRSKIQDGSIVLNYVPSSDNVADIFTKAFSKVKLNKFNYVINGTPSV